MKTTYFQAQIMVSVQAFPFSFARAQIPPSTSPFNPCHAGCSQSEVIVDAKVSDRQRRCCAPCRNIIGCKSSFTCRMCFLVLFAFCLAGCSSTGALRRFSAKPKWYLLLCYTLLWFKRHCLGIPPVRWPFMMQLMHILSCQLDFSNRPRLVKSSIPNFKIKTVNWSLRQKG